MQHPVKRSKVTAPKPASEPGDMEVIKHEFTPKELATLGPVLAEAQAVNDKLNMFLNHLVREHDLPQVPGGYMLTEGATGLIGRRPKQ